MPLLDEECRTPEHDITAEDALNGIKDFPTDGLVGKAKEYVRIIGLLLVSEAHVAKTGLQAFEFAAIAFGFLRRQDVDGKAKARSIKSSRRTSGMLFIYLLRAGSRRLGIDLLSKVLKQRVK